MQEVATISRTWRTEQGKKSGGKAMRSQNSNLWRSGWCSAGANVFEIRRGALWGWAPEFCRGGSGWLVLVFLRDVRIDARAVSKKLPSGISCGY